MPLHPQAKAYLEQRVAMGARPVETLSVEQARQQALALVTLQGVGQPVGHVEDRIIPGQGSSIPIRVYAPQSSGGFPVLVYFHGGGWVTGNLDTSDVQCRLLTNAANCVVVSVNYRHAPEHKFPAAAEDVYTATHWVAENAASINGDARRIAVAGASSGGNLAAVVALMARDRGAPHLLYQLLIVPVTNYAFDTVSYRDNAAGYSPTRDGSIWFWNHYLATEADGLNPYASPLRAENLRDLPPAHVITAEFDPLRDEGDAYAARLRQAGVPVTHTCCAGMVHGFLGAEALENAAAELRKAFLEPAVGE